MFIKELAQHAQVSTQTIRYYESIGLLLPPQRAGNNYRDYAPEAVERLRFIASARSLGFNLEDIREFLAARDTQQLPCRRVIESLDRQIALVDRRIADLLTLRGTLENIRRAGQELPLDKRCDEQCVCYLLTFNRDKGQVLIQIQAEAKTND